MYTHTTLSTQVGISANTHTASHQILCLWHCMGAVLTFRELTKLGRCRKRNWIKWIVGAAAAAKWSSVCLCYRTDWSQLRKCAPVTGFNGVPFGMQPWGMEGGVMKRADDGVKFSVDKWSWAKGTEEKHSWCPVSLPSWHTHTHTQRACTGMHRTHAISQRHARTHTHTFLAACVRGMCVTGISVSIPLPMCVWCVCVLSLLVVQATAKTHAPPGGDWGRGMTSSIIHTC